MKDLLCYFEIPIVGEIITDKNLLLAFGKINGFRNKNQSFWLSKQCVESNVDYVLDKDNDCFYIILNFFEYVFLKVNKNEVLTFLNSYQPKKSYTEFYITNQNFSKVLIVKYNEPNTMFKI